MTSKLRKSLRSIDSASNNETLTVNDDEAERSRYRKQLEEQAKASSSPQVRSSTASTASSITTGTSVLESFTAQQLNEHFTSCLKLSAENKINVKNAFDLQLIDYMAIMLKKKDSSMCDLSRASTTLDASAKIYGCRVDSLYNIIVNIASSLSSNKNLKDDQPEGEEEGAVEIGEDGKPKKKKKKSRPKKTVLQEHSLNSINRKLIEKGPWNKFLIDYSDNTMLLNTGLDHEMLGITMSNSDYLFPRYENPFEPSTELMKVPLPELQTSSEICPTFAKFSWDIEESATTFSLENDHDFAFDVNKSPEPIPDVDLDDAYDDHFADMGGGMGDDYDDEASEVVGVEKLTQATQGVAVERITDVTKLLSVDSKEYSYFDDKLLELWKGPSHWKIKKQAPRRRQEDAQKARAEKLKQKKEFKIEFNRNLKVSTKFKPVVDIASTLLANKTVKAWTSTKVTYQEDCHANPADILKFFLHSRLCVDFKSIMKDTRLFNASSRMPTTTEEMVGNALDGQDCAPPPPPVSISILNGSNELIDPVDDGAPDDYYDCGPGDEDDFGGTYLPEDGPVGVDDDSASMAFLANEYTSGAFIGDNLLPLPNRVNKIDLQINKRRKIIDMQLLKKIIWHILDFGNRTEEVKFIDVYKELLVKVPSKMQQDVTCPLVFFAVLILTNEKKLSMIGEKTEDIVIGPPQGPIAVAEKFPSPNMNLN